MKKIVHASPQLWYEKVYVGLLLVIFGGIVVHAPLSVGLGVLFPHYDLLIKSWKEILMGLAAIILVVMLWRRHQFGLLKTPLMIAIGLFALLHLLLLPLFWQGTQASLAGILIDLRYLFYFVLVWAAVSLYPGLRRPFIWVGIAGALLVTVFAVLQVTVLPYDILKYIGYSKDTIEPYLTVDLNRQFIRINSTLRGPNPLGAYAGFVITVLAAYLVRGKLQKRTWPQVITAVLAAASLVSLWAGYSRSAYLGALMGVVIVLVVAYGRRVPSKVWIGAGVGLVLIVSLLIAFRHSDFVSTVVLHQNLHGGSSVDSNEGHVSSLTDALAADLTHPLGTGVGSTGSASLLTAHPVTIENQYLFDAHEAGWLALVLLVVIYVYLFRQLWRRRADWLSLGVFAGGIGLLVVGLFLPVWVDDTVSIIWWGITAVAMASSVQEVTTIKKGSKRD